MFLVIHFKMDLAQFQYDAALYRAVCDRAHGVPNLMQRHDLLDEGVYVPGSQQAHERFEDARGTLWLSLTPRAIEDTDDGIILQ